MLQTTAAAVLETGSGRRPRGTTSLRCAAALSPPGFGCTYCMYSKLFSLEGVVMREFLGRGRGLFDMPCHWAPRVTGATAQALLRDARVPERRVGALRGRHAQGRAVPGDELARPPGITAAQGG